MVGRTDPDAHALFVCASDDPQDVHPANEIVTFRVIGRRSVTVHTGSGSSVLWQDADGLYRVSLPASGGALITAE